MAGSKRILFVEDDHFISEMYARMLTKAGYSVEFAYTGTQAVEKGQAAHYDLILLDLMLPEKSGLEVLSELRAAGQGLAGTKIVILTNLAQDQVSAAAAKAKADGYLIKADIVPSKLLEVVSDLLK